MTWGVSLFWPLSPSLCRSVEVSVESVCFPCRSTRSRLPSPYRASCASLMMRSASASPPSRSIWPIVLPDISCAFTRRASSEARSLVPRVFVVRSPSAFGGRPRLRFATASPLLQAIFSKVFSPTLARLCACFGTVLPLFRTFCVKHLCPSDVIYGRSLCVVS